MEERRRREGHERKIRVKARIGSAGFNNPYPGPDKASLRFHIFWEIWVDRDVSTDKVALNIIHLYEKHWWEFWKKG